MIGNLRTSEPRSLMTGLIFSAVVLMLAIMMIFGFFTVGKFVLQRINDPIVLYYGDLMRYSQLDAQSTQPTHCATLRSSNSNAEWICFDTMQEVDAFIESRQ
jgi:hypothetical protein